MSLIADRFLVCAHHITIDLASGNRVELLVSTSGGVAEQARWAARCERFARLHHRSIAPLVDYGPFGEGRRFEAWRVDGRWRGSSHDNEQVRARVEEFFKATGWHVGRLAADCVRTIGGRAVIVPPEVAGVERKDDEPQAVHSEITSPHGLGINAVQRNGLAAIAQLFGDRHNDSCRTIAICARPGSGVDAVLTNVARAARLNGFIPLASHVLRPAVIPILKGRSVALLVRGRPDAGWSALVHLALVSQRPIVGLFVGVDQPRGVYQLALESVSVDALKRSVMPAVVAPTLRRRISVAARRARGLPGRFEALVWGHQDMDQTSEEHRPPRAAESAASYGEQIARAPERGRIVGWPAPGELANLRKRLNSAMTMARSGRHAAGDRTLRQVGASLARRHDWEHAAQAGLALAQSLLARGRAGDAHTVLTEARDAAVHQSRPELLHRIAVLTGLALTDDARVEEAEVVLSAALASARGLNESIAALSAGLALARCQFWQGRFDAAHATLKRIPAATVSDVEAIRVGVLRSRVAVGLNDFSEAIEQATTACDRSRRTSEPDLISVSASASAFAHLAVGDHPALLADVSLAVTAARRAHNPLHGLRARLLAAESHRRQGRRGPGLVLCRRIRRLKSPWLPAVVRFRSDLLGDLLSAADSDETAIVQRHCRTTGLGGLVLFAPLQRQHSLHTSAIADIVTILQCCQTADEESRLLGTVCARLRERLGAAGVSFFSEEGGAFVPVASDGSRVDSELAPRVVAADQPIAPHHANGRLEAGAPVRYAGRRLGVLLARWTLGGAGCDAKGVVMLLATAATAAAPAVAAVMARRSATLHRPSEIIGISEASTAIRDTIDRAAGAPFAVLVEGESGTGKELVARALHRQSVRRDRPFCTLNCAALPDDLVESELFGHSRGAFTGALAERPGVFEEAHSGTLFLDEIGELSLRAQAKVLRTVQEGELRRVGENNPRRVDVRLIAATNRNLRQEVTAGRFRLDLLYRLDVIRITLPPLRERRDDIPLLAEHFWREAAARIGSSATLSTAAIAELARYDWPGNVRELQNVLAALAVRTPRRGVVPASALPPHFHHAQFSACSRLDAARRTFDSQFVRAALVRTGGHRARAARELGVTRQGLAKLIVRLGLNEEALVTGS